MSVTKAPGYAPYVPRLLADWPADQTCQTRPGTMVFADISGFTAMSERLAVFGKLGAEEVVRVLNATFAALLKEARQYGGDLLKFGGDALLLWFEGDDHALRALSAAAAMRSRLRVVGRRKTAAGTVHLRMSVGVNTGDFSFIVAGDTHRELVVVGREATRVVAMEGTAVAGEIVMTGAVTRAIPNRHKGNRKGRGYLLRGNPRTEPVRGARRAEADHLENHIPEGLRVAVGGPGTEGEHRPTAIAFVKFKGTDEREQTDLPKLARDFDRFLGIIQEVCAEYGVTFFATDVDEDGGKVILVSGVPTSSDSSDERLLLAGRAILDRRLPLPTKIGANRGRIFAADVGATFRRTFTIIGDDVNLAARVMAHAQPGQFLATQTLTDASQTAFKTKPVEPFHVKGKTEPVIAVAVGKALGAKAEVAGRELPTVGRGALIQHLVDCTIEVAEGEGKVAELTGPAGIGKSHVIRDVSRIDQRLGWERIDCER